MTSQGEFYSCHEHILLSFETVLKDLYKPEFLNVIIRNAKSSKCAVKGCKKSGTYLVLYQFFKQKDNKTLR